MADYCWDCYEKYFGDGENNDFKGICKPGEKAHVLCEGCPEGWIWVDHEGRKITNVK